jgi:crotonobetaine/carnitine-CoA ligase
MSPPESLADSILHNRHVAATTISAALDQQATNIPDVPFLTFGKDTITFAGMRDRALRIAAGLRARGVASNARLAMLSINRPELVELALAGPYAGLINVPLNVYLKGEFLRHQLANSSAYAIAVDALGLQELLPVLPDLPDLKVIILLDDGLAAPHFAGTVLHYRELATDAQDFLPHRAAPLDIYQILYTSGTSGPSKGCMLSHASRVRVAEHVITILDVRDDDIQMGVMPLFHLSGQMDVAVALLTGTPLVLEALYSASNFFPRVRETGATFVAGVFTAAELLLHQPVSADDKNHPIRAWLAIPMPTASQEKFTARFGIPVVGEMYACTEAMPVATFNLSDPRDHSTSGRILSDIEVRVADDEDNPVPIGEVGEILLRPKKPGAMFSGYWNDAERTLEGWRNLWHHTGDLGRLDGNGCVTWVDRKKDSIRRKGENISSYELETALLKHDVIGEVAVHAVRPEGATEDEVKACIVVKAGQKFDMLVFAQFINRTLPHFAIPRYVELMSSLPRNPIGRIQKFELRHRGITKTTSDLLSEGLVTGRREARKFD